MHPCPLITPLPTQIHKSRWHPMCLCTISVSLNHTSTAFESVPLVKRLLPFFKNLSTSHFSRMGRMLMTSKAHATLKVLVTHYLALLAPCLGVGVLIVVRPCGWITRLPGIPGGGMVYWTTTGSITNYPTSPGYTRTGNCYVGYSSNVSNYPTSGISNWRDLIHWPLLYPCHHHCHLLDSHKKYSHALTSPSLLLTQATNLLFHGTSTTNI